MNIKNPILILGSTGSIGKQAIDVAIKNNIPVLGLAANRNVKIIESDARKLKVKYCAMADKTAANDLKARLADTDIKVYSGEDGILEMIQNSNVETVLNSIIGESGLMPTLTTIKCKKRLALANKESLVVAGDIVMSEARKNNTSVVPVDSEHCAIHQCLKCGKKEEVKKLILTASGGPFYGKSAEEIRDVTIKEVLAHPTWSMGAKITVDSATLMNKGFEVIEAMHLFDVPAKNIDVVVHRESIIHSMVEYIDNSIIAQLSVPDMRFCIQYALSYPDRINAVSSPLDLAKVGNLSFGKPDTDTFSLLKVALYAADKGGALPAVLNAANEVAVGAFLEGKITFPKITQGVSAIVEKLDSASKFNSLDDIIAADRAARKYMKEWLS